MPALPAYPREAGLLAFEVAGVGDFRFYIDRAALAVAEHGVVRYTLVARSGQGVDSASFEGLRCESAEYRIYAQGRAGKWEPARLPWRPLAQRWHVVLAREYFCPQSVPIRNAAEGILALQRGGHPFSKGFSGDALRGN